MICSSQLRSDGNRSTDPASSVSANSYAYIFVLAYGWRWPDSGRHIPLKASCDPADPVQLAATRASTRLPDRLRVDMGEIGHLEERGRRFIRAENVLCTKGTTARTETARARLLDKFDGTRTITIVCDRRVY